MKNENSTLDDLTQACFNAKMGTIKKLTKALLTTKGLNVECCGNLISSACLAGHLNVVQFLFDHPHPLLQQATHHQEYINLAIVTAMYHEHADIFKYLKISRPQNHSNYFCSVLSSDEINECLSSLSMKGNLDIIKIIHESVSLPVVLQPLLFMDHILGFGLHDNTIYKYWLDSMATTDELQKNPEEIKVLIESALCHSNFEALIMLNKKIPLKDYIDFNLLKSSIGQRLENITFINEELDYCPSPKTVEDFKIFTQHTSLEYHPWRKNWQIAISVFEIKNEKNKLSNQIVMNHDTVKRINKI